MACGLIVVYRNPCSRVVFDHCCRHMLTHSHADMQTHRQPLETVSTGRSSPTYPCCVANRYSTRSRPGRVESIRESQSQYTMEPNTSLRSEAEVAGSTELIMMLCSQDAAPTTLCLAVHRGDGSCLTRSYWWQSQFNNVNKIISLKISPRCYRSRDFNLTVFSPWTSRRACDNSSFRAADRG